MYKIGHGYDVHKFAENRDLIIGGVKIPYEYGLAGHSDADVLCHAISDALLGSQSLGDIGKLFPDTDEKYKNANSMKLLLEVINITEKNGYTISNLDCTIVAQVPKFSPYIEEIRKNISNLFMTDISNISVKATTEEGLGFTGNKEGIKAYCVCLLKKHNKKVVSI